MPKMRCKCGKERLKDTNNEQPSQYDCLGWSGYVGETHSIADRAQQKEREYYPEYRPLSSVYIDSAEDDRSNYEKDRAVRIITSS